jgi:hypothetical protein
MYLRMELPWRHERCNQYPQSIVRSAVSRRFWGAPAIRLEILTRNIPDSGSKVRKSSVRLLGVFIFILALSIAFPMPGFNLLGA